jgi:hypothetical protein
MSVGYFFIGAPLSRSVGEGFLLEFRGGGEVAESLGLSFFFVDVLNGDDAADDLVIVRANRGGADAKPRFGAVATLEENLFGVGGLALKDGAGEGILMGLYRVVIGTGGTCLPVFLDWLGMDDWVSKDILGTGIAHDDASFRGLGDDDADGDGIENSLESRLAAAQGLYGFFVVVDVFQGPVPSDDFVL